MHVKRWHRTAGVLLGAALLWLAAGSPGAGRIPMHPFGAEAQAAPPPAGDSGKTDTGSTDMGNAGTGQPADTGMASEPTGAPATPAAAEAPAMPSTGASAPAMQGSSAAPASAPPMTAKAAPDTAAAGSSGAPAAAGLTTTGGKIEWGREFRTWDVVTGYVLSNSHGNRLVQTYIYPPEAARVYKHNAELARLHKTEGYQPYPDGTQIVQESWLRNNLGGPGKPGPVFLMRKENAGYDPSGGNWRYGFTLNDLSLVGEGHTGKMSVCKECHARAESRDYVYATER